MLNNYSVVLYKLFHHASVISLCVENRINVYRVFFLDIIIKHKVIIMNKKTISVTHKNPVLW